MPTERETRDMAEAYAACALWSSLNYRTEGDDPTPFDDDYSVHDIAAATLSEFRADCTAFLADNAADIAETGADPAQTGHDFWLTRNGHGAGFWDRGYGEAGDRLTAAAHVYGSVDLYETVTGEVAAQ